MAVRVRCEAVRYFREPQPGVIEAYITDISGIRWQIVQKAVMFDEWKSLQTEPASLPMEVSLECLILTDRGEPSVTISLPGVDDRVYEVDSVDLLE